MKKLLIVVICLIILLVVAISSYILGYNISNQNNASYSGEGTKQNVAQEFCDDITYDDYKSLYYLVLPNERKMISEAAFENQLPDVIRSNNKPSCKIVNVDINGNNATVRVAIYKDQILYQEEDRTLIFTHFNNKWYLNIDTSPLFSQIAPSNTPSITVQDSTTKISPIKQDPSWHTILTTNGGNGDTSTSTFNIRGNQWRIDYTTSNDTGNITITPKDTTGEPYPANFIMAMGVSSNSKIEHTSPGQYYLDINSIGQTYSITVEDYY